MNHEIDRWNHCYPSDWSDKLVEGAMAHPAKFSSRLIHRIYNHLREAGWLQAGDFVLDPFGGVALGALDAMRVGAHWIGVELEKNFAEIGNQNITLWNRQFSKLMQHWGDAVLLNGDSRHLNGLLLLNEKMTLSVSSPPYADSVNTKSCGIDWTAAGRPNREGTNALGTQGANGHAMYYGTENGQLGAMKANGFSAAVSSPPFRQSSGGPRIPKGMEETDPGLKARHAAGNKATEAYGSTDGQMHSASDDDFWLAAKQIVAHVFDALQDGGHAIWVTKDFIKGGQIVPFVDQWRLLCESVGFRTLHEHHAMLISENGVQMLIDGSQQALYTEQKSFFRRITEHRAAYKAYWKTLPRSEQAKFLSAAKTTLNKKRKSDQETKKRPTRAQIYNLARKTAFKTSGADPRDWNADQRIDYEVVLCMVKDS